MYDLGIIGAGPAGYVAAERAGHKGLKVVIFDKRWLGGVCLNEGCIPTKTLLYSAKIYENSLHGNLYGIHIDGIRFNYPEIIQRKDKVVKKLVAGVAAKMKSAKAEVVFSEANIIGRDKDFIIIKAGDKEYNCKNLLIATGSEAALPPIQNIEKYALTNREILQLNEFPSSINIIGGGIIGVEFASFFASLGAKVRIFEILDDILPEVEPEIKSIIKNELTKKSVEFYLKSRVKTAEKDYIVAEVNGQDERFEAPVLLVATGRKLNIDNIGLENIGVEFSSRGIKVDKYCRTNIPNVYAAGDVTGVSLLAHTAYREAEVAVNNILGEKDIMRYEAIPSVIYTNPEIASVGITEKQAKEMNIDYISTTLPMTYSGRFVAENEGKNGLIKVIAGKKFGEILGVHMVGNPSSEIIYGAAMAIEMKLRIKDLQQIVFPHPTVSEILKEIAFSFKY